MKVGIRITGADVLRHRMMEVAELAGTDKFIRKGMSNAARIISKAQKALAPIRRNANQRKFKSIGKVTVNGERLQPIGPKRLLPPGVLKRSIGFRVRKDRSTGEYAVVIGANVGKKKKSANFAPHAAFVGSGTKQRFSNGLLRETEIGPKRANRGRGPANPYIRVATNMAAAPALRALEAGVQAEIAAAVGS